MPRLVALLEEQALAAGAPPPLVALTLMARLVGAVRPEARLVLVGDPGQLTSIEAGAVLGDIVGPAARDLRMSGAARAGRGDRHRRSR